MSGSDYNYDDQGQFFPFFMLVMVGVVTVPLTYNVVKPSTDIEQTATRIESDFKPKDEEIIQAQRWKQKRKERKTKRIVASVMGWAFMAYMIYLIITTQRLVPKVWDPYDILGVSRSAAERDIDKFYRKLSLKYHPDKARPDASKNETLETINDRWVEMTKAYKALTDEEVRNNYLMYGNPDGRQSTSIGIALPKWMVEEGNRWIVVVFYGVLLGVFLPYAVGKWWYGTQALTKDKVLHSTAGKIFREYKEELLEGDIVTSLSIADEFKDVLSGSRAESGASKLESRVLASGVLSSADQQKLKEIDDPLRRKVACLIWAYLGRIDLDDAELEKQKYETAPIARQVNNSLCSITQPFLHVQPLESSYHINQSLVQAIAPGVSPLLQLPNFTPEITQKISEAKPSGVMTLPKFMSLPSTARRQLCAGLSDAHYSQAMKVASQIPFLHIAKVFFKVPGDRVVTPGSQVQLIIKGRIIPPSIQAASVPEIDQLDLEDIDPDETDIDAIKGRKPAKNKRRKGPDGKIIEEEDTDPIQPALAHAPFYPAEHAPRWHVFLSEARTNKIAVHPTTFTQFDKPIFKADGTPTFNMQTLRYPFIAPPQIAKFQFIMHAVCDSYIGLDSHVPILLDVRPMEEAQPVESEDEISEPEEDSLAGQLQAMKTGQAPSKPKRRKAPKSSVPAANVSGKVQEVDDSEEDESDTEGEDADTSETDTETEDES